MQYILSLNKNIEKWKTETFMKQMALFLKFLRQHFRGAQKDTSPKYFFEFSR